MPNFLFALLAKVVRGTYSISMMLFKPAHLFGSGFFCFPEMGFASRPNSGANIFGYQFLMSPGCCGRRVAVRA